MIILMSKEQMCKKYNKLVKMKSLEDFVIVNATNSPQFRDFANVLTDVEMTDSDDRSYKTGISAMAFQMSAMIFEEREGSAKRNNMLNSFFTNDSFEEMFVLLLAKQLSRPTMNIFICIEDNSYELYADEYLHAFGKICGIDDAEGVVFLWNDVEKMEKCLRDALEYKIDNKEKEDDGYNEDWEEDVLLDLRDADSNKEIRKLFFKYMILVGKPRKIVSKAVKEYVDTHGDTIGDSAGRMIKKATDEDHKKKKKKHKKHRHGDNFYDDYEREYDERRDDDDDDDEKEYRSRRSGSLDEWVRKVGGIL